MLVYKGFVKNIAIYYLFGSVLAIFGVGIVLIPTTISLETHDLLLITSIVLLSFFIMFAVEYIYFKRHIQPIKEAFTLKDPSLEQLTKAYRQIHRFPMLTGYRILGPHLFGLSIPAIVLTYIAIYFEFLHIPYEFILYGIVCAVLIAGMHAMIEYYHTSSAIIPLLDYVQEEAKQRFHMELTLEGRTLVSLKTKFQLSALLFGAFPLILFSLATQVRLAQGEVFIIIDYWIWSGVVLIIGCGLSLYGAKLLFNIIQLPLTELHSNMKRVQQGKFHVRAADYFSDEFSETIHGFNHMVKGLETKEKMNNELYESFFETLATTLDARDSYTAGHSIRVAEYAVQIGKKAGLSKDQLQVLRKTGLLHDIGKIGVPDHVLLKTGKLTAEEFNFIKQHPVLGEEILRTIQPAELMEKLIPGVRSHHERMDGRGYPDQLRGPSIPLTGRILAVADAFDAMTSDRPYRKGMSASKALTILIEGKGTQWDRRFVDYFCEWYKEEHGVKAEQIKVIK